MEHLLLCVALLTGIDLVFLDFSSMQLPTVGFHRSRLALDAADQNPKSHSQQDPRSHIEFCHCNCAD